MLAWDQSEDSMELGLAQAVFMDGKIAFTV